MFEKKSMFTTFPVEPKLLICESVAKKKFDAEPRGIKPNRD